MMPAQARYEILSYGKAFKVEVNAFTTVTYAPNVMGSSVKLVQNGKLVKEYMLGEVPALYIIKLGGEAHLLKSKEREAERVRKRIESTRRSNI